MIFEAADERQSEQPVGAAVSPTADPMPVLELRKVSKHFGGVAACDRVDLQVGAGEVVAIVGHNGAGKSTILRIVSGAQPPDEGQIFMSGQPVRLRSVRDARAHGIETVPQELALAPKLDVAANVFLGREEVARPRLFRFLARRGMEREARRLIGSLGVQIPDLRAKVGSLSGGQRQGVAIARALSWGRTVVVLDEPTAALGVRETEEVEKTVLHMKGLGLGILLVSHDLDQVFRVADRVYVLYHGRVVGSMRPSESTHEAVLALITGGGSAGASVVPVAPAAAETKAVAP
ncbi:MAG: rbsA 14 [Acidimicrobiaceae bacterium]|nr:rbsA 14 [Acidimicrobiaceae bacterium]